MAQSDADEMVADAEIEGVPGRSAIGGFVRGLLWGLALALAGLIGWSLSTPLPDDLPSGPAVEIVAPPEAASGGEGQAVETLAVPEPSDEREPLDSGTDGGSEEGPMGADAARGDDAAGQSQGQSPSEIPAAPDAEDGREAAPGRDEGERTDADGATGESADALTQDPANALAENIADAVTGGDGELPVAPETAWGDEATAATGAMDTGPALALDGPALVINARSFAAPEGAPLLAVVISDVDPATIDADAIGLLTMPLTFAIRPDRDGATELAASARASGHEVLAEFPFAEAAGPGPAATTDRDPDATTNTDTDPAPRGFAAGDDAALARSILDALATLPTAIGATAPDGAPLTTDRRVMTAVIDTLQRHGHAFLELRAGIGTTVERLAEDRGVPYVESNRYAAPGASEQQIYQMIEGAAFQARRAGSAVVSIAASPDALKAVLRWGLERGGQQVWLAPLSAVIARRAAG